MAPQEELLTVSTTSCTDSQSWLSLKTSLLSSVSPISEEKHENVSEIRAY